jgi:hypothetical protein
MEEQCGFVGVPGRLKSGPSTPTTTAQPPRRSQRKGDHKNVGVIGRQRL